MNIKEKSEQFFNEINKVYLTDKKTLELIFIALLRQGHVLFESVPGTGKTMLSKAIAKAIGGDFKRLQFTPDILPTDITGMNIYNQKSESFELALGPIDTNVLLADEINRATPRTQSALLEVMSEQQVTIDGNTIALRRPFIVLATQNQIESKQGTFHLPEAQMDRFLMKIDLGYPEFETELLMMDVHKTGNQLENIKPIFTDNEIIEYQKDIESVDVNSTVKRYILDIISHTRHHDSIELGVSPRGTLALMNAARALSFIHGRNYVTPLDVKYVAPFILSHRIVLSIEGTTVTTPYDLILDILKEVQVPVEKGANRHEV